MKQLLQNLRTGETQIVDVPVPTPQAGQVLVRTAASLVSAGTERMVVEFAEKSLLGKARSRPDLVRQVLDKARREGLLTTLEAAFSRLEQPMELGYSSAGVVVALGEGVQNPRLGQRVACAGGGYAVHAEYACVPTNLLTPLSEAVDFETAAFTTLGAIALHGFRLSKAQIGERVAVIGLGSGGTLYGTATRPETRQLTCFEIMSNQAPAVRAYAEQAADTAARRDERGRLLRDDPQVVGGPEVSGEVGDDAEGAAGHDDGPDREPVQPVGEVHGVGGADDDEHGHQEPPGAQVQHPALEERDRQHRFPPAAGRLLAAGPGPDRRGIVIRCPRSGRLRRGLRRGSAPRTKAPGRTQAGHGRQ